MNDRNHVAELGFKCRVEIRAALYRAEAVTVCEFCEDSDIAAVFELDACPSRQDRELAVERLRTGGHDLRFEELGLLRILCEGGG